MQMCKNALLFRLHCNPLAASNLTTHISSCSLSTQVPGQSCWPSESQWNAFNRRVAGQLIKTAPIARSCYSGPEQDAKRCDYIDKMWSDQDFQTENPIGRPLPYNITCAPVDVARGGAPTTQSPTTQCLIGQAPVYAVNVTSRGQIAKTLRFAQQNNLRLAVASTGHDMMGRSDGYGSLEIWLRHFRNSIKFQRRFRSVVHCAPEKIGWTGPSIRIDGAWQWRDVHVIAKQHNVVVVSGGSVSPGATGGWPSGGGHGPAAHAYGLGADQILEAEVMLGNGKIVFANACQHTDLYRAIRGGGPGYGVVIGTTIKAHPNVESVAVNRLTIVPKGKATNNAPLLDAIATLMQTFPAINDAGLAGYGYWFRNSKTPLYLNATSGYNHNLWIMNKTVDDAKAAFAPARDALRRFSDQLIIEEKYTSYGDYWSFYDKELALYDPAGSTWAMTSRMLDPASLKDYEAVREYTEVVSGKPEEYVGNAVLLISGGQVYRDGQDPNSGLHPAWRTSPVVIVTYRNPEKTMPYAERLALNHDITFVKGRAGKQLAPNTGGYMNEGDVNDPDFQRTFYGSNYQSHLVTKSKYDPHSLFYCPSCVGSEAFVNLPDGPLCRSW